MKKGLKITLIVVLLVIIVLIFLYILNIIPFNRGTKSIYSCVDCKGEHFDFFSRPYDQSYNCCEGTYYETW